MLTLISALQHLPFFSRLLNIPQLHVETARSVQSGELLLRSAVFRHACKTPLAILLTSLSMLTDSTSDRLSTLVDSNVRPADVSMSAAKQLVKLFKELERTDLPAAELFLLDNAVREVVTLLNRGQLHYLSYLGDNCLVQGNRLYFQEALACVITNALESYTENEAPRIVLILARPDIKRRACIEVVDFGKGMTPLAQRLALLEGVSYKSSGTGLGLSFTRYTINDLLGGELTISSQVGLGTRVRLDVPLTHQTGNQNHARS